MASPTIAWMTRYEKARRDRANELWTIAVFSLYLMGKACANRDKEMLTRIQIGLAGCFALLAEIKAHDVIRGLRLKLLMEFGPDTSDSLTVLGFIEQIKYRRILTPVLRLPEDMGIEQWAAFARLVDGESDLGIFEALRHHHPEISKEIWQLYAGLCLDIPAVTAVLR